MKHNRTAFQLLHRAIIVPIQLPVAAFHRACCIGQQALKSSSHWQVDGDEISEHVPKQALCARRSGLQASHTVLHMGWRYRFSPLTANSVPSVTVLGVFSI